MSDLISRQNALDALKKIMFTHLFECGEYIGEDTREFSIMNAEKALDVIENLSSANTDQTAKAEMLEEPFKTSMTWEGKCSNCGCYTIHEMNYCFGCGAKLYWGE